MNIDIDELCMINFYLDRETLSVYIGIVCHYQISSVPFSKNEYWFNPFIGISIMHHTNPYNIW